MNWQTLLSSRRYGFEEMDFKPHDQRTEFQRDYDRIIFSSAFRRLQNKTQVFPLPGSIFVHNRLTHSLEVACAGRSIGTKVGQCLAQKYPNEDIPFSEIGAIVSAACLAHDLGNPPFGHSGEKAIGTFFSEGEGLKYKDLMSAEQWADFTCFEGNANAFRLLTHQFIGRRHGGFALTYSTLASIVKYPYQSIYAPNGKQKFGFFISEKDVFSHIANKLQIEYDEQNNRYFRYPLVYLVEAADDICYQLMDIEDAYRLHIITYDKTVELLSSFLSKEKKERANFIFEKIEDKHERIAYLRSTVMGLLIDGVSEAFMEHEQEILNGQFSGALIDCITPSLAGAYKGCSAFAYKNIYRSQPVVDIELAGFRIITDLLSIMIEAVESPHKAYSKHILDRIPEQYDISAQDAYTRIQSVLDYVSGMTDVYALDLYRKITGMSLPAI